MNPIIMRYLILLSILAAAVSCKQTITSENNKPLNLDSIKQVLMKTDQDFSDLSKAKGRNTSFLEYMDEHVTFLRPNGMPLIGKDTMQKRFAQRPDTSYTLTWKPLF